MAVTFDPEDVSDWYLTTTVERREDAGARVYVSLETITTSATDYEPHGWLESEQERDPETVNWWEDVLERLHLAKVFAVEYGVEIPDDLDDSDLEATSIRYAEWHAEARSAIEADFS